MALGYRKEVVLQMTQSGSGPLPEWPGLAHLLREGVKALGVISMYLAPTLILGWSLGAQEGWSDVTGGVTYCLCSLLLVPLTLPATPLVYMTYCETFSLSMTSGLLIFGLSACTTLIIPAGFMRVAIRGSFIDALHLPRVIATISVYTRLYVRAWWDSLRLSVAGLSLLVLSPWGIAWSYLGIVLCFNQILAQSSRARDALPYQEGWLTREHKEYETMIHDLINTSGRAHHTEDDQESLSLHHGCVHDLIRDVTVMRVWGVYVPLPKAISKLFS